MPETCLPRLRSSTGRQGTRVNSRFDQRETAARQVAPVAVDAIDPRAGLCHEVLETKLAR